ncbi:MAG: hypothetical protein IM448_03240 [Microcystis sp. M058S1]|uniref:hypothetical protein n=1 Tax=Microcystis sp. M058S1 TaxID=2771123 RepID=UPI00258CF5A9|nr:hypothetical protein [Microcystis sp. M058S1]MCA2866762.1 hypothetical protein [Microcystis sp. M058S1]
MLGQDSGNGEMGEWGNGGMGEWGNGGMGEWGNGGMGEWGNGGIQLIPQNPKTPKPYNYLTDN